MASFFRTFQRLGAIVGGRRRRSSRLPQRARRRPVLGRASRLESLEERTLLAVGAGTETLTPCLLGQRSWTEVSEYLNQPDAAELAALTDVAPAQQTAISAHTATIGGAIAAVEVQVSVGSLYYQPVDDGGVFLLDGAAQTEVAGTPMLPVVPLSVLLPPETAVGSVQVSAADGSLLDQQYSITLAAQAAATDEGGGPGLVASSAGQTNPAASGSLAELVNVQHVRGYTVAVVNVYPLQATAQGLRFYSSIHVTVQAVADEADSSAMLPRGLESDMAVVAGMVANPQDLSAYGGLSQTGAPETLLAPGTYSYVLITSTSLVSSFNPLIAQKLARGVSAIIYTVEDIYAQYSGTDRAEQVRNFIRDAYNTWSTEYVLLGGDTGTVPHRAAYASCGGEDPTMPTDLYFACLDGSWNEDGDSIWGEFTDGIGGGEVDLLSEVYVGRAPVDTATQAQNFVNKTIQYETTSPLNPKSAVWMGEYLWYGPNGEVYGSHSKDPIRDEVMPSDYNFTTLYEENGTFSRQSVVASLNASPHVVNHLGHGDTDWAMYLTGSIVDGLTNTYPFLAYSQACYAGSFDLGGSSDSVAEHFVYDDHGAFAVVMNSRYGWGSTAGIPGFSHWFDYEFWEAIFPPPAGPDTDAAHFDNHLGGANHLSKELNLFRVETSGTDRVYRWIYFETNLLGDPETPFRSGNNAPELNPGLGALTLRSIQESDTTNFGTRVMSMLTSGGLPADEVISDPDTSAREGIAVIKTDTANGSWEFTTNNGATWHPMGNCSIGSARLLPADAPARIRFVPNPGFSGTAAIMFRAWDQTTGFAGGLGDTTKNGGKTAFSKGTATASITVTPVNDAPVVDTEVVLSLESIDENVGDLENVGTLVSGILASGGTPAISDLDSGDPQGIAVTGVDTTHGTWEFSTDDGDSWTPIDSELVSTGSAALLASDDSTRIRFVPAPDFYGKVSSGISFRAWDQTSGVVGQYVSTATNGSSTAFSEDTSSASITVNWINDSPALVDAVDEGAPVVLAIGPIHEDPSSNAGTLVSEALAVGDAAKYPIRDPDEEFSPGPGIAMIGADTANGTWQFSTDNGVLWFAVGAVSDDSALLLPADSGSRLRFLPSPDFNTTTVDTLPSVTFRAWDRTAGVSGSTFDIAGAVEEDQTAFSAATGTIHVEVLAVNDAPVFALVEEPNQETWEGAGEQSTPLVESFAPGPDTALDELDSQHFDSFIVTPADPSLFTEDGQPAIDSTGTLTYTPAPFAHGATTVTVQVVDDGGTDNGGQDTSAAQTFTITVQWVNQAPTFVAPAPDQAVDEGDGAQAVANWAQSIAPGPNDPTQGLAFYVRVVSSADLHKFKKPPAVSKDGTLTYELAPYEFPSGDTDSIAVSVMLQDDGGRANGGSNSSAPVVFTIDVTPLPLPPPVNGVPEAFGQQAETDANLPVALILEGDDGDGGIQTLTFAIDVYPNSALGTITAFDPDTGEVEFTPKAGAFGLADFTFTVTDDDSIDGTALTSDPVTVEIWIDPVVQVPTGRRDNTLVLHLGANDRLQLDCTTTGQKARLFDQPLGLVEKLTILGSDGKADVLTVDFKSGGYFALADLIFDGGADGQSNALAFRGTSDADDFVVEGDGAMANDVAVAFQNVGQVRFDGSSGDDTYTIASLDHSVRITDSKGTDTLDFSGLDLSGVADGAGVTVNLSRSRGQMQTPIQGAEASLWLSGTIEYLVGSDGDDSLTGGSSANVIHGGLGSDLIHGNGGTDLLFGDGGDDTLYADSGLAVLLGGEGNDTLYAGKKRSILIGGTETDTLTGSSGQTVLIGGTTAYDENDVALMAILKDWGGSGSFKTRVARLRSSANPLALTTTVFDDSASDTLTGGKGYDWFLPFAGDDGDVTEGFDAKKDITG